MQRAPCRRTRAKHSRTGHTTCHCECTHELTIRANLCLESKASHQSIALTWRQQSADQSAAMYQAQMPTCMQRIGLLSKQTCPSYITAQNSCKHAHLTQEQSYGKCIVVLKKPAAVTSQCCQCQSLRLRGPRLKRMLLMPRLIEEPRLWRGLPPSAWVLSCSVKYAARRGLPKGVLCLSLGALWLAAPLCHVEAPLCHLAFVCISGCSTWCKRMQLTPVHLPERQLSSRGRSEQGHPSKTMHMA